MKFSKTFFSPSFIKPSRGLAGVKGERTMGKEASGPTQGTAAFGCVPGRPAHLTGPQTQVGLGSLSQS